MEGATKRQVHYDRFFYPLEVLWREVKSQLADIK